MYARHQLCSYAYAFSFSVISPRLTNETTASMGPRNARAFPEEAALHCRSGTEALKGNLPERATLSFRQALALNPMLWEAFDGLCAIGKDEVVFGYTLSDPMPPSGSIPEIDDLFPPRPPPAKRPPPEDLHIKPSIPIATGAGFFTPDTGNAGNLFRGLRPEPPALQAFRMAPPANPRDSM